MNMEDRIQHILGSPDGMKYDPKKLELAELFLSVYIPLRSFIRKSAAGTGACDTGVNVVLEVITIQGRSTLTRLCEILSISKPTASLQVDRLVKEGLVVRKQQESDRRVVLLEATETGREQIARSLEIKIGSLIDKMKDLSEEEVDDLTGALIKIQTILGDLN